MGQADLMLAGCSAAQRRERASARLLGGLRVGLVSAVGVTGT